MILDAMQANQAEGVAMCDAHPDLEVFRLRLGKSLNYEYNEDSQTGLFSRRDPREGENTSSWIRFFTDFDAAKVGPGLMLSEVSTVARLSRTRQRSWGTLVMNKLEKVALRSARRTGKPLILVLNNVHLFNNDDGGRDMLLQLQQRAEAWAASGE
jgi:hypothetical protein